MTDSQRKPIIQLADKETLDWSFLVSEKYLGTGKNGKPFLAVKLSDQSGVLDGRLWDRVEESARSFEVGQIIRVKGQIQIFQNRKQLVIHRLDMCTDETLVEDYIPKGSSEPQENYAKLIGIVSQTKNTFLKQLFMDTLEDVEIKSLLMRAPAAKSIHHAWMGGLLEHILSICYLMEFLSSHYRFLNRDLLIFGAIFHDIGKIWEMSLQNGIHYTHKGRLLGHMLLGCELVEKKSSRILGFPDELKDLCKHIILSHHGKYEYGSPKRPKFLEAYVVAMVDEMDSKISNIHKFIEAERSQLVGGTDSPEHWSKYSEIHDRYFLIDDLNAKLET